MSLVPCVTEDLLRGSSCPVLWDMASLPHGERVTLAYDETEHDREEWLAEWLSEPRPESAACASAGALLRQQPHLAGAFARRCSPLPWSYSRAESRAATSLPAAASRACASYVALGIRSSPFLPVFSAQRPAQPLHALLLAPPVRGYAHMSKRSSSKRAASASVAPDEGTDAGKASSSSASASKRARGKQAADASSASAGTAAAAAPGVVLSESYSGVHYAFVLVGSTKATAAEVCARAGIDGAAACFYELGSAKEEISGGAEMLLLGSGHPKHGVTDIQDMARMLVGVPAGSKTASLSLADVRAVTNPAAKLFVQCSADRRLQPGTTLAVRVAGTGQEGQAAAAESSSAPAAAGKGKAGGGEQKNAASRKGSPAEDKDDGGEDGGASSSGSGAAAAGSSDLLALQHIGLGVIFKPAWHEDLPSRALFPAGSAWHTRQLDSTLVADVVDEPVEAAYAQRTRDSVLQPIKALSTRTIVAPDAAAAASASASSPRLRAGGSRAG